MDNKLKRRLEIFGRRYQEFSDLFYNAATEYGRLTNNKEWGSELEVGDTWFTFSGSVPCGRGCCSSYGSITVPFEFLYDREKSVKKLEEKQRQEADAALEAKRVKEQERMLNLEREERNKLAQLKAKYGE